MVVPENPKRLARNLGAPAKRLRRLLGAVGPQDGMKDRWRIFGVRRDDSTDVADGPLHQLVEPLPPQRAILRVEVVRHCEAKGGNHDPPRGLPPPVHPPSR